MPQIILKESTSERTVHLGSYTFFTRDVKKHVTTRQPPKTTFSQNTYHCLLSPCEYCKVFKNGIFLNTSRSSCLQIFLKIGILKSFANFTGKQLCWSLFLKNSHTEGFQLYRKDSNTDVFL